MAHIKSRLENSSGQISGAHHAQMSLSEGISRARQLGVRPSTWDSIEPFQDFTDPEFIKQFRSAANAASKKLAAMPQWSGSD